MKRKSPMPKIQDQFRARILLQISRIQMCPSIYRGIQGLYLLTENP